MTGNLLNTYFDNAATTWPKPPQVVDYMNRYLTEIGGTYGRSAYMRVVEASRGVEAARDLLAQKFGTSFSDHIFFTNNATHGINIILQGLSIDSGTVLVSPLEHNATMRPLHFLAKKGAITIRTLPHFPDGSIDPDRIHGSLPSDTKLVILNHQSNINGVIQPVKQIKECIGEIPLLLDTAQSLGYVLCHIDQWKIDIAVCTGHKGLFGPTGTGAVFIRNPERVAPFMYGGTGSNSESLEMPEFVPDRFEAGTPNVCGIFGLLGALEHPPLPSHTRSDVLSLIDSIKIISGIRVFCAEQEPLQGELFSISHTTIACSELSSLLYQKHRIETRSGLHCAPFAHQHLGTFPQGTTRIAPSPFHTTADFEYLIESIQDVVKK